MERAHLSYDFVSDFGSEERSLENMKTRHKFLTVLFPLLPRGSGGPHRRSACVPKDHGPWTRQSPQIQMRSRCRSGWQPARTLAWRTNPRVHRSERVLWGQHRALQFFYYYYILECGVSITTKVTLNVLRKCVQGRCGNGVW